MFAVIYRSYVKEGKESIYQEYWQQIANYFIENCGAIGSCLHKTEEGYWLAYSRWPDKATRDAAWPGDDQSISKALPLIIKDAIVGLQDCLDQERKFPEICMELVKDYLP